jgi:hypothetical protein
MTKHHYRSFFVCVLFFSFVGIGITASTVSHAASSVSMYSSANPSYSGDSISITWDAPDGAVCRAPWTSDTSSAGGDTVNPTTTTTYTVNCGRYGNGAITVTIVARPPTITSFYASPSSITSGNSSGISWSSSSADSCNASGFSTGGATSGTVSVTPPVGTNNYTLTCTGPGGSATANTSVKVAVTPLSGFCSVNPTNAATGQAVTWSGAGSGGTPPYSFSWIGENLTSLSGSSVNTSYLNPGTKNASVSVTDSSSIPGSYSNSVQDSVVCTGSAITGLTGDVQDGGYRADAIQSAKTEALALLDQYPGNCVMASVRDYTSCDAGPGGDISGGVNDAARCPWIIRNQVFSGSGVTSGTYRFPQGNVYSGSAVGTATAGTRSQTVVQACSAAVTVAPNAPTSSFSANPVSILAGASSTLSWSSTNASSCTGGGFNTGGATSGSATVSPGTTTNYSVSCTGAGGTSTSNATVSVTPVQANLYNNIGPGSNITAGGTATLFSTTYNNGNGPAYSIYDLYLIYDSAYNYTNANDSTYYAFTSYPAGAGGYNIGANSNTAEYGYYQFNHPGIYYYRMLDDWPNYITETNEGDNWSSNGYAQIRVKPTPPTGLTYSCNATGNRVTLTWNPTDGARDYYVRVGGAYTTDNYASNSITYTVTPNQAYPWWVHANAATVPGYDSTLYSDPTYSSFNCSGQPDLTASTGAIIDTTVGVSTTFGGDTKNIGLSGTGGTYNNYVIIYSDTAGTWATTDSAAPYTYAGRGGPLAAGATQSLSGNYTFAHAGVYYYRLCTDWDNEITESNESNNCGSYSQINVKPTQPTLPSPNYVCNAAGDSVTLAWNADPGAANGYYVRLYDGISNYNGSGLAAYNNEYTGTSVVYPVVPGRAYSWWVHTENTPSNYSAPTYGSNFTCAGLPDLTPTGLTPLTVVAGTPATFTATLKNNGTAPTPPFSSTIFVCDSTDSACIGDSMALRSGNLWEKFLAYIRTSIAQAATSVKITLTGSSIPASSSGTQSGTHTFSTPGSYSSRLCADLPLNQVAESNEKDNCGSWTLLSVCPSGYTVDGAGACVAPSVSCTVNPPSTINKGDTVTFTATPSSGANGPFVWTDSDGFTANSGGSTSFSRTYNTNPGPYQMSVKGANTTSLQCSSLVTVNGTYCTVGTPVLSITANPNRVKSGDSTNLAWSATNVLGDKTVCSVSSSPVSSLTNPVGAPPTCSVGGTIVANNIITKSKYTLSCTGGVSTTTTVNVIPAFKEF